MEEARFFTPFYDETNSVLELASKTNSIMEPNTEELMIKPNAQSVNPPHRNTAE